MGMLISAKLFLALICSKYLVAHRYSDEENGFPSSRSTT